MALRMNLFTGKPEFIEDTPVVNETTGQQANTAEQTATATVAPDLPSPTAVTPTPQLSPVASFTTDVSRGVDVTRGDEARTTDDVFNFNEELLSQAQGLLQPTEQSETDRALDQQIRLESEALARLQTDELALEDSLLGTQAFSEDRLVDIGTIRGEQAQAGRVASARRRSLALEKQTTVNALDALINRKTLRQDAQRAELQATRENFEILQQLSKATLPDVLKTEINPQTGEVFAIVRDPQTGAISTVKAGNITPEQAEFASNPKTFTNALGQVKIWYTDAEGNLVIENLDNTVRPQEPKTPKAPSGTQFQAGTFASRIEQSEAELSGGRGRFIPFLPKFVKSEDRRLFEQAERNFINAVLRRESGAAIADTEFDSARQQYIPLASDPESVLAEKAQNRKIVFEGLKLESGDAFEQIQNQVGGVNAFSGDGLSDDEAYEEYLKVIEE